MGTFCAGLLISGVQAFLCPLFAQDVFAGGGDPQGVSFKQELAFESQDEKTEKLTSPADDLPVPGKLFGTSVHALFSLKFRVRWNGADSDQDLYEYLSADVGDVEEDPVTAHFFLRATEDLDGNQNETGFYPYDSVTDTYDNNFNARFYTGYVDIHQVELLDQARLGRQILHETPLVYHFDGAQVETSDLQERIHFRAGAYGGIPVHLFESSTKDDSLFGAYLKVRPFQATRARIDYSRIRDEYLYGDETDSYYTLSLWQGVGEKTQLHYRHALLDGNNRDLFLRASFSDEKANFRIQASMYRLLETQKTLTTETDFYFSSLQQYHPYWQGRMVMGRGFGDHLLLEAGADVRELAKESSTGTFNREFRRFYFTPSLSGWPFEKGGVSITGEVWEVPGANSGDIRTAAADVQYRVSKKVNLTAGTSYALYKYDYFQNEERENVRTYSLRGDCRIDEARKVQVIYEYEDADWEDNQMIRLTVSQSF